MMSRNARDPYQFQIKGLRSVGQALRAGAGIGNDAALDRDGMAITMRWSPAFGRGAPTRVGLGGHHAERW